MTYLTKEQRTSKIEKNIRYLKCLSNSDDSFSIVKEQDETKANDTTFADDTELTFEAEANSVYFVEAELYIDSHAEPDVKLNFSMPTDATHRYSTGFGGVPYYPSAAFSVVNGQTPEVVAFVARNTITTVSAGIIAIQWAQRYTSTESSTLKKGSVLHIIKLQ